MSARLRDARNLKYTNNNEIENKCLVYNSSVPDKIGSDKYRAPKFDVPYQVRSNLLDEDFTIKEISSLIGVSERIIYILI